MNETLTVVTSVLASSVVATIIASLFARSAQREKSELDYGVFERQERFRNLYNRRAGAIYQIYPLAVEVRRAWASLLSPAQVAGANREQQAKRAYDAANALRDAAWEHKLLFPPNVVDALDAYDKSISKVAALFATTVALEHQGQPRDYKMLGEAFTIEEADFPAHVTSIESGFRKLLGSDYEQVAAVNGTT